MKIFKLLKRIGLVLVGLVVLALLTGVIYEQIARANVAKKFPTPGALVNVGDHHLHYVKKGSGGPTVVFESGLDLGGHLPWNPVQTAIAARTTTISYDRAGVMWSERGKSPKTCAAISEELHQMLEQAGCPKPYILVGHSLAGITMRPYIAQHRENLAGAVLVDVSHPDQMNRFPEELKTEMEPPPLWLMNAMFATGIGRMMMKNTYPNTQPTDSMNVIANAFGYKSIAGSFDEIQNLESLLAEAAPINQFDSLFVTVITGTSPTRNDDMPADQALRDEMDNIWNELQKDLLNLSTNSEQVLAPKAGHYVQLEQPEVVIAAIENMIEKVRSVNKE